MSCPCTPHYAQGKTSGLDKTPQGVPFRFRATSHPETLRTHFVYS